MLLVFVVWNVAVFGENSNKIFPDMTGVRFDAVVDGEFDVGYFFTAKAKEPGFGVLRGIFFKQHNKMASMMAAPDPPSLSMLDTQHDEEHSMGYAKMPELNVGVSGLHDD